MQIIRMLADLTYVPLVLKYLADYSIEIQIKANKMNLGDRIPKVKINCPATD